MVRLKNRYIVVELRQKESFRGSRLQESVPGKSLEKHIRRRVRDIYGEFGLAATSFGLSVKYCNRHTRVYIIRVSHGPHRFVLGCLPLLKNSQFEVHILHVAASLRHCFLFIQKHQKTELLKVWSQLSNEEEKHEVEKAFMHINVAPQNIA